ncbi:MAG: HAMP domain-containing sensor histidine kinase [Verrucomicrobiota bacterium]|nr:HAMP domain-containing sensor histidine kinase [Verrucomicrobiota bacterium]
MINIDGLIELPKIRAIWKMSFETQTRRSLFRFGKPQIIPALVISLILAVLGLSIILVISDLRRTLREQILQQDSEVLHAATVVNQKALEQEGLDLTDAQTRLGAILEASEFRGEVSAIRLFDTEGRFITAFPSGVTRSELGSDDLLKLKNLASVSHFHPKARVADINPTVRQPIGEAQVFPLIEAIVPLHAESGKHFLGAAQFLLNGERVAREFAVMDRHLFRHGLLFFAIGGTVIVVAVGWAFQRLQHANEQLSARTADLLHANHELTLAAKTSAIGAVAAHLIHGLKNPLFGLQLLASSRLEQKIPPRESDWQTALSSTKRMQSMIAEIVRILQEEQGQTAYHLSLSEVIQMIESKVQPIAQEGNIALSIKGDAQGQLSNRNANLIILVLVNLLQNAVQALPANIGKVELSITEIEGQIHFRISDNGPGLPEQIKANLFAPCRSTKEGGTGLGLAISKQLANHMGGALELEGTGKNGTTFLLTLPTNLVWRREHSVL